MVSLNPLIINAIAGFLNSSNHNFPKKIGIVSPFKVWNLFFRGPFWNSFTIAQCSLREQLDILEIYKKNGWDFAQFL